MVSRIRNKVGIVRRADANPEDNLSEIDLDIYHMMPTVDEIQFSDLLVSAEIEIHPDYSEHSDEIKIEETDRLTEAFVTSSNESGGRSDELASPRHETASAE